MSTGAASAPPLAGEDEGAGADEGAGDDVGELVTVDGDPLDGADVAGVVGDAGPFGFFGRP